MQNIMYMRTGKWIKKFGMRVELLTAVTLNCSFLRCDVL